MQATYKIEIWNHPKSTQGVFVGEFTPDDEFQKTSFTPTTLWGGLRQDPNIGDGICLDRWEILRLDAPMAKGRFYEEGPRVREKDVVRFYVKKVD